MILLVILLYACLEASSLLVKARWIIANRFFMIGSRMFFAGLLLLGHQFIFKPQAIFYQTRTYQTLFLLGFLNIYLTNIVRSGACNTWFPPKPVSFTAYPRFWPHSSPILCFVKFLNSKKWLDFASVLSD